MYVVAKMVQSIHCFFQSKEMHTLFCVNMFSEAIYVILEYLGHLRFLGIAIWFLSREHLRIFLKVALRCCNLSFALKQAAFPAQDKRLDALMLCTDEVFMYLGENLKLTPQSMSEKAVALDELQEMHQQVYTMLAALFVYYL